jgi:protoporphyrinogen/coproporphyrinogen III oxidase
MKRIVIVGGGLSGLAAAFRIRQAHPDYQLTLLEAQPRLGGAIGTEHVNGFTVERGPNGMFDAKPHALQLCRDLGLGDRLIAASEGSRRNRFLYLNGQLHRLPGNPLALLFTKVLSVRGKMRMFTEPFRRRPRSVPADESVAAFARRRFGRWAADVFLDALVTGIHAGDPEKLSVAAAFPRLPQFEKEFGSVTNGVLNAAKARKREAVARGEKPAPQRMWSFREGLQVLIDTLAEKLGGVVRTGVSVSGLSVSGGEWTVHTDSGERLTADAVVLTTPADHQAKVLSPLNARLGELVGGIRYAAVNVAVLGYREADAPLRPDGFGYIAPQNTRRDVLGVQWCSSTFPDRAPPGHVLWRALAGGVNRPDMTALPDDEFLYRVQRELALTMGVTGEPAFTRVVRWPKAIPQYEVGHPARVAEVMKLVSTLPGLILGGNAYHGVAVNDCCEQAEAITRRV